MIRTILCGIAGRMGREILALAHDAPGIEVIGGIEVPGHAIVGKILESVAVSDNLASLLPKADCVVEFTDPRSTLDHLQSNRQYKKAFVIGTTHFSKDEHKAIEDLARLFPVFLAPNMSIGVHHLYGLVSSSAKVLEQYDIEVIETHHRNKKDAPSGTARAIVDIIKKQRPHLQVVHGRDGMVGERSPDEVCVHAVRGGDVAGEHRVVFFGNGEFVELRHYATSRRCFAAGALKAVRFIVKQKSGLFSMTDIVA
ncbi:4-hydroxy-tetrahydrodipicolinate reductase [candidate division WOR-3 bacterium]|nr:4-hydroxy-tetrahydrodipicolinate reductase [candidate division WOR-3 bacterium]